MSIFNQSVPSGIQPVANNIANPLNNMQPNRQVENDMNPVVQQSSISNINPLSIQGPEFKLSFEFALPDTVQEFQALLKDGECTEFYDAIKFEVINQLKDILHTQQRPQADLQV